MELFKFTYNDYPSGEMINNTKSIKWIERYSDAGEFEIKAPLSSGLKDFLPEGTLVSHMDTLEVMIVENHEINEQKDKDPLLIITGRTFDTFLENRIVGVNLARASSTIDEYILAADYTWDQAVTLINDHIFATDADDMLLNVIAESTVPGTTGTSEERTINRGNVYERLLEILAIDDLGIRTFRRNVFVGLGGANDDIMMSIYRGEDKSNEVIFSWKGGDLDSVDYLFSGKKLKNSALVVGRYIYRMVDMGPVNYNRRMMIVDASDLDGHLNAVPTGGALTTLLSKMNVRGKQALAKQKLIVISRTDVANVCHHRYRRDYKVGDLVSLDGNFGETTTMRVVEYVEIKDENGESGHPTLSIPGE